jgi:hypothetical protein
MEPEDSLSYSQDPVTGLYRGPDESNLQPQSYFYNIHFTIVLHVRLGLPSGIFPLGFPPNILYAQFFSPTCATCPIHLTSPWLDQSKLCFGRYKVWSSSLCFLQPPIISFLFGLNVLLKDPKSMFSQFERPSFTPIQIYKFSFELPS